MLCGKSTGGFRRVDEARIAQTEVRHLAMVGVLDPGHEFLTRE